MIVLQAFALVIVWTLIAVPLSVFAARVIQEAQEREERAAEAEREAYRAQVVRASKIDVVM